jgi:two-component system LytT family sensor kinase
MKIYPTNLKDLVKILFFWSIFIVQLAFFYAGVARLRLWESFLQTTPSMILELFLVLSLGYLVRSIYNQKKKISAWLKIIVGILIIQSLFIASFFIMANLLDGIFGGNKWLSTLREYRYTMGVMGFFYCLLSIMKYFMEMAIEEREATEKKLIKKSLEASRANLNSIKASIHPHFLFNALNVLNTLIRTSPQTAQSVCLKLSEFIRYSLRYGQKEVSLIANEIEHIRNYFYVEQIRFGERLGVVIQYVEEEIADCVIPSLILFPLVENSVKHGIQQLGKGGTVVIRIKNVGERIIILIKNPCSDEKTTLKGEGVGLKTVRDVLKTFYGKEAVFLVNRKENSFEVEISFPALTSSNFKKEAVSLDKTV